MFAARRRRSVLIFAVAAVTALAGMTAAPVVAEPTEIPDAADDAYRYPEPIPQWEPKPPNPLWSNQAADMVSTQLVAQPPQGFSKRHSYTVSVSITGQPHETFNYVVAALFGEEEWCLLMHFLTPGTTRRATVSCGEGEEHKIVGWIEGSSVSVKGRTVSATYSYYESSLPGQLRKDPEVGPFVLFTCPVTKEGGWTCNDNILDQAFGDVTFKL